MGDRHCGDANYTLNFGTNAGNIPLIGDWDGNGTMTPGTVRYDGTNWVCATALTVDAYRYDLPRSAES
jgi:hypothetical protein